MKAFVAFAVLALCCCCYATKIPKFNIPRFTEDPTFTPAEMPCEYSLDFKLFSNEGDMIGKVSVGGFHKVLVGTIVSAATPFEKSYVVRSDVKDGDQIAEVLLVPAVSSCYVMFVDRGDDSVSDIVDFFSGSYPYERVEKDQEWDGITCDMYYYLDTFRFCIDADDHLVGLADSEMNLTYYNLKMEADIKDFVVPDTYTDCSSYTQLFQEPDPFPDCPAPASSSSSSSSSSSYSSSQLSYSSSSSWASSSSQWYSSGASSSHSSGSPASSSQSSAASTVKACTAIVLIMVLSAVLSLFC